jgi:hypothetical protein
MNIFSHAEKPTPDYLQPIKAEDFPADGVKIDAERAGSPAVGQVVELPEVESMPKEADVEHQLPPTAEG